MSVGNGVFVTGATGLVGGSVLARLLADNPHLDVVALVRDPARWAQTARRLRIPPHRVGLVLGDITRPGLGLDALTRARLARRVGVVLHAAADTVFGRPLDDARATNLTGTQNMLDVAGDWPDVARFAFVSSASVAGRRVGRVLEHHHDGSRGWGNAYQQSKHEAEGLVRGCGMNWVVLRPSAIVCDSTEGRVTQYNAVHYALRLLHQGVVPMLPGADDAALDAVPCDYVSAAIAALTRAPGVDGGTFHLCAGDGALPLGELLDVTWSVWSRYSDWRRKAIPQPVMVDVDTYRLFAESVEDTGDARLQRTVRNLSSFAPDLARPKRYDTTEAMRAVGFDAPAVRAYWERVLEHLLRTDWGRACGEEAA